MAVAGQGHDTELNGNKEQKMKKRKDFPNKEETKKDFSREKLWRNDEKCFFTTKVCLLNQCRTQENDKVGDFFSPNII